MYRCLREKPTNFAPATLVETGAMRLPSLHYGGKSHNIKIFQAEQDMVPT